MKKYNLSAIMKRAWELAKKVGMTISAGLKEAWMEVKTMAKFNGRAAVAIIDKDGKANRYCGTENDDSSNYLYFNLWEKNGRKRIYANDYKRRSVGYIDCNNSNEIISDFSNNSDFVRTMKKFKETFAF